jgi:hypothetical protein
MIIPLRSAGPVRGLARGKRAAFLKGDSRVSNDVIAGHR